MQYQSESVTFGQAFMDTVLAALKTVPGGALITGGKIRLTTDPTFAPAPTNVPADFSASEANFSGYPSGGIAAVLSAPVNLSTTCQGVLAPALFIAASATPFVANSVYGYWIDDGTNVILAERFAGGALAFFGSPGDFLDLVVQLPGQLNQAAA